uniref:Uncharacterized protein n=1 Tax=Spongospora subterranea TaxID=70186 RepID=A0A0H5QNT8_9EUKA|eukprot:CRZ03683.1 hypothetical protein [Spongospora subterranea]
MSISTTHFKNLSTSNLDWTSTTKISFPKFLCPLILENTFKMKLPLKKYPPQLLSLQAEAAVPFFLGAASVPSLKLVLNLRGTLRRYLMRPVPVVFLRIAFTLQLYDLFLAAG